MESNLFNLSFNDLINEKLKGMECSLKETEAYIKSTFVKYIKPSAAISNKGVTLSYFKAKNEYNFKHFQNLADELFFLKCLFPDSLNGASSEYYNTVAQLSYYKCYNILNKEWKLFEELSDSFPYFVEYINTHINNNLSL